MKFNVTALALTVGLIWAAVILAIAAADLLWPGYGRVFLSLAESIYPGYHAGTGIGSVVIGTIYALVDGAIGGAVFGFVYNWFDETGHGHSGQMPL